MEYIAWLKCVRNLEVEQYHLVGTNKSNNRLAVMHAYAKRAYGLLPQVSGFLLLFII